MEATAVLLLPPLVTATPPLENWREGRHPPMVGGGGGRVRVDERGGFPLP